MKLMFAALLRASETWRGIRITEFELRQLTLLRNELNELFAARHAPAAQPINPHPALEFPADGGLDLPGRPPMTINMLLMATIGFNQVQRSAGRIVQNEETGARRKTRGERGVSNVDLSERSCIRFRRPPPAAFETIATRRRLPAAGLQRREPSVHR
jgi:hypothetical protein